MGSYRICFFTRKFRAAEAEPPDDIIRVFKRYAECGTHMAPDQFRRFLEEEQGSSWVQEAERILEEVLRRRHPFSKFTRHSLTLYDFHYYLFSTDLNPPIVNQVHDDMHSPLTHYFVFTGHNSYLTGNQLSSNCSDIPIIESLKRGVRVVELDLWPNSRKDDINVVHGWTLTKHVKLITCLRSIKEHAFSSSPYPVIITLEDHLRAYPALQAKVAKMITQTFKTMLYFRDPECSDDFPSPEDLKHRILVSTKPPKEYLEANDASERENSYRWDSDADPWGQEVSELTTNQGDGGNGDNEMTKNNQYDEDAEYSALQYKSLISIHAGKPKGGLKEALKVEPSKVRRLSLSEQALEKAISLDATNVVGFTQQNFLRIYPKGTRFNSSNYKPFVGLLHGAQMIAFNMQGYGRALWLMHGIFRANGGCGYVKKPEFLMNVGSNGEVFDPRAELPIKSTLKVKVYMGDGWNLDFKPTHFDRYSPPDFYTRVGIAGAPADERMEKTKKKEDNWKPVWNEEFVFPLTIPEMALLRVEVHEYDMSERDDFGGQTCLPVSELKSGIRSVPLFDHKGCKLPSVRLLMGFEFL